jgi:hypothetical protein
MKKSVALFKSHNEAIKALHELRESGVDLGHVSLVGRAEIVDDTIHVKSNKKLVAAPVMAGIILGTTGGCMAGVGVFSIPGLPAITNAGIVVGALAGFGLGVIIGGIITILMDILVKENRIRYKERIKEGSFLMFINGTEDEIAKVEKVIHGKHLGLTHH